METEPHAARAVDLQQPLREFRVEWGTLLQGVWWDRSLDSWMLLGTDFMISILASPHIKKWSEVKSLSHVLLFVTLWTVAYQAPLSMGFSRQEYWNGLAISFSRGSSWDRTQVYPDRRQTLLPLSHQGSYTEGHLFPGICLMGFFIRLGLWVWGRKITEVKWPFSSHHIKSTYHQHNFWLLILNFMTW